MDVKIEEGWRRELAPFFEKPDFQELREFVWQEYSTNKVYPPAKWIFRAFDLCPFDFAKVVILGQDPYHGPDQANGLCFSVGPEVPMPPSLKNIFKEIAEDLGREPNTGRDLIYWARQGVLLLNATLTVRAHQAGSHQKKGWEEFTDWAISRLAEERQGLVFILWGSYAQKKGAFIDTQKHCVIKSPHPSPLSAHRGFFGSRPFSKCNAYLESRGEKAIDW